MWDDFRRAQRRFADKYWFQIATVIWFFMLIIYLPPPWSMRVTTGVYSGYEHCMCGKYKKHECQNEYMKKFSFVRHEETYTVNDWICTIVNGPLDETSFEGETRRIIYDANNPDKSFTVIHILACFAIYGILLLIGWVGRWILRKFYGIPPEEERENNMRSWVFRNLVSGSTRVPKK